MRNRGFGRRLIVAGTLGVGAWIAMVSGFWGVQPVPAALAVTCFSVATDVVCIDTEGAAPMPWHMPPAMIAPGTDGGVDENIVIRDDGGRHVARG
jgi:hypothetical protein